MISTIAGLIYYLGIMALAAAVLIGSFFSDWHHWSFSAMWLTVTLIMAVFYGLGRVSKH